VRLPFMCLAAGGASQRNGDAWKTAQEHPLGLEPGRNWRTGTRALNYNISHGKLLTLIYPIKDGPLNRLQVGGVIRNCCDAGVQRIR
jgi:hypothetical protein